MALVMTQGGSWDLLALLPGALFAASLVLLLFIWLRESIRHFLTEPQEYFASAFWAFAIVGTGAALLGISAKTSVAAGGVAAAVIFVWYFFAASL